MPITLTLQNPNPNIVTLLDLIRRDYTTDDVGGDNGIKENTIVSNVGFSTYTFTATTVNDAYDFEYLFGNTSITQTRLRGSVLNWTSYIAPTVDYQLVQKKYVDDGLADKADSDDINAIANLGDWTTDWDWRMYNDWTDLLIQRRESGSWVTKTTITS